MGSQVARGAAILKNNFLNAVQHTHIHDKLREFLTPRGVMYGPGRSGQKIQKAFNWKQRYRALVEFHKKFYLNGAYFAQFMKEAKATFKLGLFQ